MKVIVQHSDGKAKKLVMTLMRIVHRHPSDVCWVVEVIKLRSSKREQMRFTSDALPIINQGFFFLAPDKTRNLFEF